MKIYFTYLFPTLWIFLLHEIFGIKQEGNYFKRYGNLNECSICKVMVKSFSYWLEKTARGKYEGGDTAWEESNLKAYARSEVRLVEIQEGLCSELKSQQDQCYALAEVTEDVIEKWWFNEDPYRSDLKTWLCIETLKYCCPINHFGENCSACLQDKDKKVCSGHGKCDGEGTRQGNGACVCQDGFSGKLCEECDKNYYRTKENSCKVCHKACEGCKGAGPAACNICNTGWVTVAGVCVDIDECSNPTACKSKEYCVNADGSYKCMPCDSSCRTCSGVGDLNCTSCDNDKQLWSGICVDDNLRNDLLSNSFRRLTLYLGFFIILYLIACNMRGIVPVFVLIISIYVYHTEKSLNINSFTTIMYNYL